MKRILLTQAGSRLGMGISHALKAAPESFHLIGVDTDKFNLQRAVTDERYLLPNAEAETFLPVFESIVAETKPDLIWPVEQAEMTALAPVAAFLGATVYLPGSDTIAVCDDMEALFRRLAEQGVSVPPTVFLHSEADLERAFTELSGEIWLHKAGEYGGRSSVPVADFASAKRWLDFHYGWGSFLAMPELTSKSVMWESVWDRGRLVAAQGSERLYWEFSKLTPSGVTGMGGAHQWMNSPAVDAAAEQAIRAAAEVPHGAFSVEFMYDTSGALNVLDVLPGRFIQGGAVHFAAIGASFPYIAAQVAFGELRQSATPILNSYPTETAVVYGMDIEPLITDVHQADRLTDALALRRAHIRARSEAGVASKRKPAA